MPRCGGHSSFFPPGPWPCPVRVVTGSPTMALTNQCGNSSQWDVTEGGKEALGFGFIYESVTTGLPEIKCSSFVSNKFLTLYQVGWEDKGELRRGLYLVPSWGCLPLVVTLMASTLERLPWI